MLTPTEPSLPERQWLTARTLCRKVRTRPFSYPINLRTPKSLSIPCRLWRHGILRLSLLDLTTLQHFLPNPDLLAVSFDLPSFWVGTLSTLLATPHEHRLDLEHPSLIEAAELVQHDELVGREWSGIEVVADVVAEILTTIVAGKAEIESPGV